MVSKLRTETFSELIKNMNLQIQELHTSSINKKKSTPRHLVVELQNIKNREKIDQFPPSPFKGREEETTVIFKLREN